MAADLPALRQRIWRLYRLLEVLLRTMTDAAGGAPSRDAELREALQLEGAARQEALHKLELPEQALLATIPHPRPR